MYYGIITLSAFMFAVQFFFTDMFRKAYGDDLTAMLVSSAGGALTGMIILSAASGFSFGSTPFSLIMAVITAINCGAVSYCGLKALGKVNLSVYSLYMMTGGMVLPCVVGIAFFDERVTAEKILCIVFIIAALFISTDFSDKKSGVGYCLGIFVLNGMAGVLAKIYQASDFDKVSAPEYSFLCAAVGFILPAVIIAGMRKSLRPLCAAAAFAVCAKGILEKLANLLLLLSLAVLPASVQYPFITGGTVIFSTLLGFFTPSKPKKRELVSVAVSFAALAIMFFAE